MKPLMVDLFAGLGGWAEGGLAAGYDVVGFDIERHRYPLYQPKPIENDGTKVGGIDFNGYGTPDYRGVAFNSTAEQRMRGTGEVIGWQEYPAQLVIQDARTLHGKQFRNAALIVASPPCQEYSYMAMPWSRAKALEADYRGGKRDVKKLTELFDTCFRIQREACEAAGRHIPMVVENVRGAQKWVGRARWNFGSFYLWGDVPALMPMTSKRFHKVDSPHLHLGDPRCAAGSPARDRYEERRATKNNGGSWFAVAPNTTGRHSRNPVHEGVKQHKSGRAWFADPDSISGSTSSKSNARKAASAAIAKIPLALATHIARTWWPEQRAA